MNDSSLYVLLGIILICLSAFFSASETAYSTMNVMRMRKYSEEDMKGAKKALAIYNNFEMTITTILICNNVVNIAMAAIATIFFVDNFQRLSADQSALASTAFVTIIVLIFGEVLPKNYAKAKPENYAMKTSAIMYMLIKLLKPVSFPIRKINKLFNKKVKHNVSVTEAELRKMIDYIEEEGVIEENESDLVRSALDFDDKIIGDVLTPRTDVIGLDIDSTQEEILEVIYQEKYSRIPVYRETIDNIIGVVHAREIFKQYIKEQEISLEKLMHNPIFVPKSMKMIKLLDELQAEKGHMAIVKDEHGGTSGICTMEDLLEQLVGDIWDERDTVEHRITEKDDKLIVSSDYELDELFETYLEDTKLPDTEYSTVGGWIYELIEEIPEVNDTYEYHDNKYTIDIKILEVINHKIELVELKITKNIDEEEMTI